MKVFKKIVALMLVIVLSMASLGVVYAAEEQQESVASEVFQSEGDEEAIDEPPVEDFTDDEEELVEPEPIITPEETDIPKETNVPEATPVPTAKPEATPVPTVKPEATPVPTMKPEETPVAVPTVEPNLSRSGRSVAAEGWSGSGKKWQYLKADSKGKLVPLTGWNNIKGKRFYFDPQDNNYAASGFMTIAKRTYYFSTSGAAGVFGAMAEGWNTIDKKTYFFKNTGSDSSRGEMYTSWKKINSKVYYFKTKTNKNGVKGELLTGWIKVKKKSYYAKKTGAHGNKGQILDGWRRVSYKDNRTGKTRKGSFYFSKSSKIGTKGAMVTGWKKLSGKWYYLNDKNGDKKFNNGVRQTNRWLKIKGQWYYFDKKGVAATGWKYIGGLKYYFFKSGKNACALDQDVRNKVKGPYRATVNRKTNTVTIYARDGAKGYTIPVKAFACSVGMPSTPTPTGTFRTMAKYRVKELMGPSWGQYATRIVGGILFHSVAGTTNIPYNISADEYNRLGGPASHGCVRLTVRDAKWIYDNCSLGMTVTISDKAYQPFDKPATTKIPASQNWDPTDPAVAK